MKTRLSLLLAALCCFASIAPVHAQSTAFTYQGRLTSSGGPANGSHDFQFTLFGAPSGGSPVDNPVTLSAIGVTNGVFTVLLDFGSDPFAGADRWLDIAVRPAGGGAFTPLTPRQPITPTPYAVTALFAKQVPGVSGNALHAADGGPQNAVFVDNAGNVGVGTTSPASKLHVASAPDDAAPPRLQSSGGTTFNAGFDFYPGGIGRGYVGVPDSSAAFAAREMLVYGGPGTRTTLWSGGGRSLTADPAGNIGIGTDAPAAKLDVRGDIRMGPNGQFRAASSEENLRIVRGLVGSDGTIRAGFGFQVSRTDTGTYAITFDPPFAGPPVVTAMSDYSSYSGSSSANVMTTGVSPSSANLVVRFSNGDPVNARFHFTAIGPR